MPHEGRPGCSRDCRLPRRTAGERHPADADPITTEVDPPWPQLGRRGDQADAGADVDAPNHLRGARLRGRPLRPAHAAARAGAEPAPLHGHDEFLHRGRRRGGRRRGRSGPGRHHPHERPVQDRLAPPGRGDRDAGVPARGGARRLRGDQGALARHRRQGDLLHRHDRRLPGGHDLPGRQALPPRRARRGHQKNGDGELAATEVRARRHQRRSSRRPRRRSRAGSTRQRYGFEVFPTASSGCTTTARPSCAATSRSCRTAGTSAAA